MNRTVLLSLAVAGMLGRCSTAGEPVSATAHLAPAAGQTAQGTVRFVELADHVVEVHVDLSSVPPGQHGLHIHEKGDCGDNGNAAGAHFNPDAKDHGAPAVPMHHAGDFGNVTADAKGRVHATLMSTDITLGHAAAGSATGRAVVLHGGADDLATQPSGKSGPRIACGVITLMNAPVAAAPAS